MNYAFPLLLQNKTKSKLRTYVSSSRSSIASSSRSSSPKRPSMTIFDDSPNARSKTMKTVDGPHTYGRLNEIPAQPGSYTIGVAEDMGARRTMEDSYSFVVDYAGVQGQGFFAIFDGHAGKHAAEWCGQHFHEELLGHLARNADKAIPETIADTFLAVDTELTKMSESTTTTSGCTAVTAFLRLEDSNGRQPFAPPLTEIYDSTVRREATPAPASATSTSSSLSSGPTENGTGERATTPTRAKDRIRHFFGKKATTSISPSVAVDGAGIRKVLYTANAGDARAVLARNGKAVRLTYDHKGNDKKEVRRIQEAGGFVLNNRVNGVLAVTRSLGDSSMKEYVVGSPYTSEMELSDGDDFLILACDGLWDVTDDQGAVDLIKDLSTAQEAADLLVRHALDNFSHDNVTVLVVKFGDNPSSGSASSSK